MHQKKILSPKWSHLGLGLLTVLFICTIDVPTLLAQKIEKSSEQRSDTTKAIRNSDLPSVQFIKPPASMRIDGDDKIGPKSMDGGPAPSSAFNITAAILEAEVSRVDKPKRVPLVAMPALGKTDTVHVRVIPTSNIQRSQLKWTLIVAFFNPGSPPASTNANKNIFAPEIRLFENDQWYKEHSFASPGEGMVPLIFLVPKNNYRDRIFELLTKKRDQLQNVGNFAINLTNERSKFERFFNGLQEMRANQPTGADGLDLESRIRRIADKGGFKLPANWKTVEGSPNPTWDQILNKLIRAVNPNVFESHLIRFSIKKYAIIE